MLILILMLVVNLIQSLKYIFLLAMMMRNLAIGFGMNKTGKSSEVEKWYLMNQVMYKDKLTVVSGLTEIDQKKSEFVNLDELTESTV